MIKPVALSYRTSLDVASISRSFIGRTRTATTTLSVSVMALEAVFALRVTTTRLKRTRGSSRAKHDHNDGEVGARVGRCLRHQRDQDTSQQPLGLWRWPRIGMGSLPRLSHGAPGVQPRCIWLLW